MVQAFLSDWSSGDQVTPLTSYIHLDHGGSILSNLFNFEQTILETVEFGRYIFLFPFSSAGANI